VSKLLLPGILLALAFTRPAAAAERDFTFFLSSDVHLGSHTKEDPEQSAAAFAEQTAARLKSILAIIGQPYPKTGPLATLPENKVAKPIGFLLAGDLTDGGDDPTQWPRFEALFPPAGLENGTIPLFLAAGNHDGGPNGATRKGIVARNQAAMEKKQVARLSANGLHAAWCWQGVHFINVNLCPADETDAARPFKYGQPGKGSWNDPVGALTFLTEYLRDAVKDSGAPVIIMQHYGYCEGFNFDWDWWSPQQRRAFYDLARQYNVVALLHGHTHAPAHYCWPDPSVSADEVKRLFGDAPPADLKRFEVFSAGSVGGGACYVFQVHGDRLIAAHHGPGGWTNDPAMFAVKSLLQTGK
jgi:3',5'-cyclic AMP phosphodiesterase CpdA